jgi:hypothetical protein
VIQSIFGKTTTTTATTTSKVMIHLLCEIFEAIIKSSESVDDTQHHRNKLLGREKCVSNNLEEKIKTCYLVLGRINKSRINVQNIELSIEHNMVKR